MQHNNLTDPTQPTIGRRQHARLRTNFAVKITSISLTSYGHLIDLSLSGAKFAAPRLISPGVEVLLHWQGSPVLGEISWTEHRQCGVRFVELISGDALLLARSSGAPVPLSRVQQLAAEFAREREYRKRPGGGWAPDSSSVVQFGRFGLRRV
jgi:hypothetical protein